MFPYIKRPWYIHGKGVVQLLTTVLFINDGNLDKFG